MPDIDEHAAEFTASCDTSHGHEVRLRALETHAEDVADTMATLDRRMQSAVAKAMREVLCDGQVIATMADKSIDHLQKKAAERTGRWVWGWARSLISRWLVVGFVLLWIAKTAGVGAAVQLWKWLAPVGGS